MIKTFPDLPGWRFEMDEISAGVYEVTARDGAGHCVSAKDADLEAALQQCCQDALQVSSSKAGMQPK